MDPTIHLWQMGHCVSSDDWLNLSSPWPGFCAHLCFLSIRNPIPPVGELFFRTEGQKANFMGIFFLLVKLKV